MAKMMRNCICLLGLLAGLAGSGMGPQKSDRTPMAAPSHNLSPIRSETRNLHREHGEGCEWPGNIDRDACVWIDFEYPVIIFASSESAKTKINHAIQQLVLEDFGGGTIFKSWEALTQDFTNGEKDFHAGGYAFSNAPWWFERRVKVEYQSANVLSLSRKQEGYTGGAHGWGRVDYANFRPSTGAPIRLRDILKPGFEKPLNSIGEVRFRALENLDPKASLRENSFSFPNDQFQLNDNFFIDAKGLTFVYNSYEISCGACGAPSVFLPYSDLRTLLRPDANIP
ncbi:MAG: DUF3298 and DUF4163 domain-containing protein [Terriglobia bacterium]|jgi:hypothetical protein